MSRKLILIGEYNLSWENHRATIASIEHSQRVLDVSLEVIWCSTEEVSQHILEGASGFWIATGTPYKSMNNALEVIRYARDHKVPCLGTCQGFQHIMLEYAQTSLGIENPGHEEYSEDFDKPFIAKLACSLRGQEMELNIVEDSLAFDAYCSTRTTEKYYCNYGINPDFAACIDEGILRISGSDSMGAARIVEYRNHPFLVGTLFVPQARSQEGNPHPLVTAFIRSICLERGASGRGAS